MSRLKDAAFGKSTRGILERVIGPQVGHAELCDALGYVENAGVPTSVVPDFIGQFLFDTTNSVWYKAHSTSAGGWSSLGGATLVDAGAGATSGTGTVFKSRIVREGEIITSEMLIDLTGLASSTTDLDIIGVGTSVAHIGQVTAAENGTIFSLTMTCVEVPAGGADDIDLYMATEGTGIFDGLVTDLTETALITAGAAWTLALTKAAADMAAAANKYLYLTGGEAGTAAAYTAGKFIIQMKGYV